MKNSRRRRRQKLKKLLTPRVTNPFKIRHSAPSTGFLRSRKTIQRPKKRLRSKNKLPDWNIKNIYDVIDRSDKPLSQKHKLLSIVNNARNTKNCKERPDPKKGRGSGPKRTFVPWCRKSK